jgi:hypothetical protein
VARPRVRGEAVWCQPPLPGLDAWVVAVADATEAADASRSITAGSARGGRGGGDGDQGWDGWEARWLREACQQARLQAQRELEALEARLHARRPGGYVVDGWRTRTLVTRLGDLRVRRRLYRGSDGQPHFLLDEHLGWPPRQVLTPAVQSLLVDWAATVPFRTAAQWLERVTAGVVTVSGTTAWRALQAVAQRAKDTEATTHQAWATTGALPPPQGERVVPVL